jgi:hypothetical protein
MKMKLVPWIREAHGTSGDTVFREVNGETIVASKPGKRTTPFSEAQVEMQDRFLDARDYYEKVKRMPELLALYEQAAEEAGKSVYMMCRKDWYHAPKVRSLALEEYNGQAGGVVKFKVLDEILADRVIVTISDEEAGTLIEKGEAVPEVEGTNFWMYTATTAAPAGRSVVVQVEAYDHPGNKGQVSGNVNVN